MHSAHSILGVGANASEAEIRSAYKRLALECHPDKNRGNEASAQESFVKIKNAYDQLISRAQASAPTAEPFSTARETGSAYQKAAPEDARRDREEYERRRAQAQRAAAEEARRAREEHERRRNQAWRAAREEAVRNHEEWQRRREKEQREEIEFRKREEEWERLRTQAQRDLEELLRNRQEAERRRDLEELLRNRQEEERRRDQAQRAAAEEARRNRERWERLISQTELLYEDLRRNPSGQPPPDSNTGSYSCNFDFGHGCQNPQQFTGFYGRPPQPVYADTNTHQQPQPTTNTTSYTFGSGCQNPQTYHGSHSQNSQHTHELPTCWDEFGQPRYASRPQYASMPNHQQQQQQQQHTHERPTCWDEFGQPRYASRPRYVFRPNNQQQQQNTFSPAGGGAGGDSGQHYRHRGTDKNDNRHRARRGRRNNRDDSGPYTMDDMVDDLEELDLNEDVPEGGWGHDMIYYF